MIQNLSILMAVFFVGSCQSTNNTVVSQAFTKTDYILVPQYHDETRDRQSTENIQELARVQNLSSVSGVQILALPVAKPQAYQPTRRDLERTPYLLKGLSEENVLAMFGEPSFKRVDRFGAQWQYRTRRCTLDLFLYDEIETGESALVDHFDIRGANAADETGCVSHIMSNRGEVRRNQIAVLGR